MLQRAQKAAAAYPAPNAAWRLNDAHPHYASISGHGSTLDALEPESETYTSALAAMRRVHCTWSHTLTPTVAALSRALAWWRQPANYSYHPL